MSAPRTDDLNTQHHESLHKEKASHGVDHSTRDTFRFLRPNFRFSLFGRAFIIITAFMVLSLSVWGIVVVNALEEHRANQLAERVTSALNIAQKSIQYAAKESRSALIIQLATPGDTQVFPREASDPYTPLGNSHFESLLKERLSQLVPINEITLASELSDEKGLWLGFKVDDELYWLFVKYKRDLFPNLINEGFSWLFITLAIALFGAAISVRMLTRPLKQLAHASKQLAHGENPAPLSTDKGPFG